MSKFYRIDITAHIGGKAQDVPAITCESMDNALDKLTELGNTWRDRLDNPMMREIGGRCELFLSETKSITGLGGGDIIRTVRIDRPIHSPSARVIVWDEEDRIVSDSWKQDQD